MLPKVMNSRGVYYHRGQNGDIKSFTFTLFIPISVCVCQGIGLTTYSCCIISSSDNVMSSSASAGLGLLDLSAPAAATSAPSGVSSNAAGLLQADTTDAAGKIMIRVTLITPPPNLCFSSD